MKYSNIIAKILKDNINKYILYFCCNVLVISICYVFISIIRNETFMDENKVNSLISSNIVAPTIFTLLFSLFFIPYSFYIYNKQRQFDYGIFISIGIEYSRIKRTISLENFFISVLSIITGILFGNILLFVFFLISNKIVGVSELHYELSIDSTVMTIVWFIILYSMTLLLNLIQFEKKSILTLLKSNASSEYKKNLIWFCLY